MGKRSTRKSPADKITIEPPKPRKPLPPPSRPLKDRRKEAERRKTREKPGTEDDEE